MFLLNLSKTLLQQVVSSPLFNNIEEPLENGVEELKKEISDDIFENGELSNIQIRDSDLMVERNWEDIGLKFGNHHRKAKERPKKSWKKLKKRWSRFKTGFKIGK